jgi:hypothetical protein
MVVIAFWESTAALLNTLPALTQAISRPVTVAPASSGITSFGVASKTVPASVIHPEMLPMAHVSAIRHLTILTRCVCPTVAESATVPAIMAMVSANATRVTNGITISETVSPLQKATRPLPWVWDLEYRWGCSHWLRWLLSVTTSAVDPQQQLFLWVARA